MSKSTSATFGVDKKRIFNRYCFDQSRDPNRCGFVAKLQTLFLFLDLYPKDPNPKMVLNATKWLVHKYNTIDFDELDQSDSEFAIFFKTKHLIDKLDLQVISLLGKDKTNNSVSQNEVDDIIKPLRKIKDQARKFQTVAYHMGVIAGPRSYDHSDPKSWGFQGQIDYNSGSLSNAEAVRL